MSLQRIPMVFMLVCAVLVGPSASAQEDTSRSAGSGRSKRVSPARDRGHLDVAEKGGEVVSAAVRKGGVPLLDILGYVQKATGKVVVYPSMGPDPHFAPGITIDFLGDVEDFTHEMALSILRSNGYEFFEEVLSDDTTLLHVRHATSRAPLPAPPVTAIIGPGEKIPTEQPDARSTMVVALEHGDPSVVLQALRDLMAIGGVRRSHNLSIVNVVSQQILVIQGRNQELRFIRELVQHLDKPGKPVAPRSRRSAGPEDKK